MKKYFLLLLIVVLSLLQKANAQIPIAYYPFNGNANDAIGTLNGTVNGATLTADRFGNANSAYSFDGVNDFIGTTGLAISQNQNWTISAWVKAASLSQSSFIVLNGLNTPTAGNGYSMIVINADNTGAGNIFKLHYPGAAVINSGFTFTDINTWHYVTITRDINAIGKMYFDGVLSATTTTASISPAGGDFRIGSGTNVGFWNGAIDEVKVYNNALTDAQVQAEYAATSQIPKPGSGNAISFDGVNDYVSIANGGGLNGLQSGSIEMWVKWNGNQPATSSTVTGAIIGRQFDGVFSNQVIGLDGVNPNANLIVWRAYQSGGSPTITSSVSPGVGWNHICITYTSGDHKMFLNGMLVGIGNETGSVGGGPIPLTLGAWINSGSSFGNSNLDEVRIWNVALTQTQIRDRMCRKITATDALYPNLVAYYNFDESTGNFAFDRSINANIGTLTNSPTRVTSGAPIGNASIHDYVNATKTTSLTHPTGESFMVTSTSGNPDGIHLYRVDEKPADLNGASGVGANDKYFGVFQAGGTTPQYTAVYNYNGNPGVNAGNENKLRLNKRTDNAAASWTTMVELPNEAANTITITGESTEYILGGVGILLPLNLLSLTGSIQGNDAHLQWKTANEHKVSHFELQRSSDGQYFENVKQLQPGRSDYSYLDAAVFSNKQTVYYRLKSIDMDGRFTQSPIIRLQKKNVDAPTVFPNPAKDKITLSGLRPNTNIKLLSMDGKMQWQQTTIAQAITFDISNLAPGIYFALCEATGSVHYLKIIKQ